MDFEQAFGGSDIIMAVAVVGCNPHLDLSNFLPLASLIFSPMFSLLLPVNLLENQANTYLVND